jgi:large subunit ribosomal protein L7Ae
MPSYVKFETPKEVVDGVLEALSVAKDSGRIRKGINETTKSIERKAAKLVVIASDVEPEEIVIHIPMLCEEKGIPYVYVPTKVELGKAVGIPVPTSTIALEDAGGANEILNNVLKRLPRPKIEEKKHEAPVEKKHEHKAAEAAPAAEGEKPKKEKKAKKPKANKEAPAEAPKEEKPAEEKKE